jgi:hypothetical protein
VIRGAAAREFAPIPSLSRRRRHISPHPQKLSPFLYTLVLASLDTPGGALGDPWSRRPRAPVLRFVPIL